MHLCNYFRIFLSLNCVYYLFSAHGCHDYWPLLGSAQTSELGPKWKHCSGEDAMWTLNVTYWNFKVTKKI